MRIHSDRKLSAVRVAMATLNADDLAAAMAARNADNLRDA
jgi:hypothetical protein